MPVKLAKPQQFGRGAVKYKVEGPEDNPTTVKLSIAYDEAPVPEHYYVADYFQIIPFDLEVLMIFGKLDYPNPQKLRNKIEIYFPVDLFIAQLWRSSREFEKTLVGYVDQHKAKIVEPGELPPETDKVQTLHSNNVLMVLSAGQCMMDFFYISAKDLWLRPQRNEAIGIEALVRVLAPASVVLGFLREADKVVQAYVEKLGPTVMGEQANETVESK